MKRLFCLIFLALLVCTVSAQTEESNTAAAVTVTNISVHPAVMMRGDTGTISVEVTNNGLVAVPLSRALLTDKNIIVQETALYDSIGTLGARNKLIFTFTVVANAPDGIYYPQFSLQFQTGPSLRYRIPVQIESTNLGIAVLEKPDSFSEGRKETITLLVGNPRDNEVTGVIITAQGEGIDVIQSGYLVGTLGPDQSTTVSFEVIPHQSSDLTFTVQYKNGINSHTVDRTVPVLLSDGKKRAEPVLNNIEITRETGYFRATGDVTNAGLESANSVTITTGPPAIPVDPFRIYVVGALDPDDFSSFEVTFDPEDTEIVPLITQWKDKDGNLYQSEMEIHLAISDQPNGEEAIDPLTIGIIVAVVVAIGGIIAYSWMKKRS
jgi:hypothetical protein